MFNPSSLSIPIVATLLTVLPMMAAPESLWLEAEHFSGIRGYCWPMGKPNMQVTNGHWGLSGPGWAAEWNQGGESGFLSIAAGGNDDQTKVSKTVEIPVAGDYFVWIRYGDWRELPEPFEVMVEQPERPGWTGAYGQAPIIGEDNVIKLYYGWAFVWDRRQVTLAKGNATITLMTKEKSPKPRQIDVVVLTTDPNYAPKIKDRPEDPGLALLTAYRNGIPKDLEPLARQRPNGKLPKDWKLQTFNDRGFLYLWNISADAKHSNWLSDDPDRVKVPYHLRDEDVKKEFESKYAGQAEGVPIFSDKRIVPTFHGVGCAAFKTDKDGEVTDGGQRFAKWLAANPDRLWASMMNYHPDRRIGEKGIAQFEKYRNRYVGSISGENLGYFTPNKKDMLAATERAKTRRELVNGFGPVTVAANKAKYQKVYGRQLDANPYRDVISCLSVGNIVFAPLLSEWGCRTIGYESVSATSTVLGMRWAFMRGIARQGKHTTATYRSCNFGDAATMFSNTQSFHKPQNIYDNFYSVYSGAGMTWYKFDIWYQYMAGSSMFYHEQGFDEFWKPGGTTAAGTKEVQLSPKGQLVDRFLRVTEKDFDRGHPYTPIAILVDYAHGWEPAPYWPNSFKNWHGHQHRFLYGDHEKMLERYFWAAYHPIETMSEKPITGTSETNVAGVFGDIFDVIYAYPDSKRWTTIDSYPVVIAAGEIELSKEEGKRLAKYVSRGGTLLVADTHLSGPGLAELKLPEVGDSKEAQQYTWLQDDTLHPSPTFRYRPILPEKRSRVLAKTSHGDAFCVATDRGKGRIIYLSVPHGLSVSKQAVPAVSRLFAHLSRDLMPVEVTGDVEWLLNRNDRGWMVTILNPAGQDKPQQGITPTDFREDRVVTIRSRTPIRSAVDRLLPTDALTVVDKSVTLNVPAGDVRIIELQ